MMWVTAQRLCHFLGKDTGSSIEVQALQLNPSDPTQLMQ